MTPTETEQLKHLISLLQAKLQKKILIHRCAICGPDYVCPACKNWNDFREKTLAKHPEHFRIATEPAPEPVKEPSKFQLTKDESEQICAAQGISPEPAKNICEHCGVVIEDSRKHIANEKERVCAVKDKESNLTYWWSWWPKPPQKPKQKPGYKQSVEAYNKGDWEPAEPSVSNIAKASADNFKAAMAEEKAKEQKVCEHCKQEIKSGFRHEPNLKVLGFRQCFVEPLTIPQPTFRPYRDASEVPMVLKIRDKNSHSKNHLMTGTMNGFVTYSGFISYSDLYNNYEQTLNGSDWGPAGVQI